MRNLILTWSRKHTRWAIAIALLLGAALWAWIDRLINDALIVMEVVRIDFDDLAGDMIAIAAVITAIAGFIKVIRTEEAVKKNGYVEKKDHTESIRRLETIEAHLGIGGDDVQ